MWCIQTIDAIFRACMYDVLDLYEEPYDPKRPLVNLDEKPKQLLGEKRMSIPMKPGSPEKYDCEYIRNGTANIFIAVEFKAGKRVTQVTKRRTIKDFALFVKMLVDGKYSDVEVIRLVTDNLNTHKKKAFYETFSKDEAERILSKIEFHYTPKHASWLNAAEIEINVMDIECTGGRIGDMETLAREVAAGTKRRNGQKKKIDWKFTMDKVDTTWVNQTTTTAASPDTSLPLVTNPTATPATILLNDNSRPRVTGTNISQLNVTVTDDPEVDTVTIDLSPISSSAEAQMSKIPGTDIWSVTTNATAGINLTHNLIVTATATDTSGNSNISVSISLTVLRRGDVFSSATTSLTCMGWSKSPLNRLSRRLVQHLFH